MSRSLPSRPNLRYLKDAAKRRVRSGEFATVAQAQFAIAREFGFASWPRLSAFVIALTADLGDRAAQLVRSACSRDVRLAGELLSAQPDLSRYDLATACVTGDAEFVARRISGRPDTPLGPLNWPPILYACFSRFLRTDPVQAAGIREVVRIVLAADASPNTVASGDGEHLVALYGAAGINADPEVTAMLLAAGADPNEGLDDPDPTDPLGGSPWGNESLYHAAEFADPTCAELLMDAGAHPLRVSYCLRRALDFENPAMVSAFLRRGADPNLTVPWGGGRPALASAIASRRSSDIVRLLVNAGADLEGTGHDGVTPYQLAVRSGDVATAELLMEAGADPRRATAADHSMGSIVAGRGGSTSDSVPDPDLLCRAAMNGDVEVIRRLLKAGSPIDAVNSGEGITPLHLAAWNGRSEAVRILLDAGADINLRNPYGGDALGTTAHGSTESPGADDRADDYASIVEMLIAAGAQQTRS